MQSGEQNRNSQIVEHRCQSCFENFDRGFKMKIMSRFAKLLEKFRPTAEMFKETFFSSI